MRLTKFEPTFLSKCAHRDKFFNADSIDRRNMLIPLLIVMSCYRIIHNFQWPSRPYLAVGEAPRYLCIGRSQEGESRCCGLFLHRCLRLNPEERPSTQELLEDSSELQLCSFKNKPVNRLSSNCLTTNFHQYQAWPLLPLNPLAS